MPRSCLVLLTILLPTSGCGRSSQGTPVTGVPTVQQAPAGGQTSSAGPTTPAGGGSTSPATLPQGSRAFALRIDPAGHESILPGSRVDVLAATSAPDGGEPAVRVVASDLAVLAVDLVDPKGMQTPVMTVILAASAEQVGVLSGLGPDARPRLTLRQRPKGR